MNRDTVNIKDGSLLQRLRRQAKEDIVSIGLGFLGFTMVFIIYLFGYQKLLSGEGVLYLYLLLLVGPIAALTVWIDKVINTEQFKTEDFYWMVAGIEIGVFLVALKVLIDWYLTPENSHFEPLFVVTTISLALVEWARRIWSRVQQEYGLTREEQN